MKLETLKRVLIENVREGNFLKFDKNLDLLFSSTSDEEACQILAEIYFNEYTRYKSDYLATFIEATFKQNPNLSVINHPVNAFFKLAVIRGSKDIYDCYIEEGIGPYINKLNDNETRLFFKELLKVAVDLNQSFFQKYPECVKGLDYNGAFGTEDNNESVALIKYDDYETMESVVEKYNTILGRRDIIQDLIIKADFKSEKDKLF